MSTLTRRQQQIWQTIREWYNSHHYAPTLDEIGKMVGINTRSTVHQHIQGLISLGYLDEATEGKRAYRIPLAWTEPAPTPQGSLPLRGAIAAGRPIEAIPNQDDISPNEMFMGPKRYALKVKGESMIDIGVMDGDYVVIQHAESARNGDIVVALVDREETTLKRIYYLLDGQVELRPENRTMQPMIYLASQVVVQGRMVGLFRSYD